MMVSVLKLSYTINCVFIMEGYRSVVGFEI